MMTQARLAAAAAAAAAAARRLSSAPHSNRPERVVVSLPAPTFLRAPPGKRRTTQTSPRQ